MGCRVSLHLGRYLLFKATGHFWAESRGCANTIQYLSGTLCLFFILGVCCLKLNIMKHGTLIIQGVLANLDRRMSVITLCLQVCHSRPFFLSSPLSRYWVCYTKILIYPIVYLLEGNYKLICAGIRIQTSSTCKT